MEWPISTCEKMYSSVAFSWYHSLGSADVSVGGQGDGQSVALVGSCLAAAAASCSGIVQLSRVGLCKVFCLFWVWFSEISHYVIQSDNGSTSLCCEQDGGHYRLLGL